jgi:hypothetical protein
MWVHIFNSVQLKRKEGAEMEKMAFEVNLQDKNLEEKLKKFLVALTEGDESYQPFKKTSAHKMITRIKEGVTK